MEGLLYPLPIGFGLDAPISNCLYTPNVQNHAPIEINQRKNDFERVNNKRSYPYSNCLQLRSQKNSLYVLIVAKLLILSLQSQNLFSGDNCGVCILNDLQFSVSLFAVSLQVLTGFWSTPSRDAKITLS